MGASGRRTRACVVFVGHTEGVTHLDSKVGVVATGQGVGAGRAASGQGRRHGRAVQCVPRPHLRLARRPPPRLSRLQQGDGRYVLSNAKDQSAKLWDCRMAASEAEAEGLRRGAPSFRFDYR